MTLHIHKNVLSQVSRLELSASLTNKENPFLSFYFTVFGDTVYATGAPFEFSQVRFLYQLFFRKPNCSVNKFHVKVLAEKGP